MTASAFYGVAIYGESMYGVLTSGYGSYTGPLMLTGVTPFPIIPITSITDGNVAFISDISKFVNPNIFNIKNIEIPISRRIFNSIAIPIMKESLRNRKI